MVRVIDDDRVGSGNVQAGLDDARADQHVDLAAHEGEHDGFQLLFGHLAVGDGNAHMGQQGLHVVAERMDRLHAILHDEHLSAAPHLALHRFGDNVVAGFYQPRAHGNAVHGRCVDNAQIPHAHQRHVQRAWNGCGRQRQHVHLGFEFLDFLLVRHPEALLLVHHQQAQLLGRQILGQQPVRADKDVDVPGGERGHDLLLLRGRAEAAQHVNAHRDVLEAFAERVVMLLGENGGRHQHDHLLAAQHHLVGRAHGHLGFAEAHVPAHEAIHGLLGHEVRQDLVDRYFLVLRFLECKSFREFGHQRAFGLEGVPRARFAGRVEGHQLLGHVFDGLAGAGLGALPGPVSQPVQRGCGGVHPGELLHLMEPVHRDVHLVAVGINQLQEVTFLIAGTQAPQSIIAPDAVLHVHHQVALLQLAQGSDKVLQLGFLEVALPRLFAENLLFGDQRKARLPRTVHHAQALAGGGAEHHDIVCVQ